MKKIFHLYQPLLATAAFLLLVFLLFRLLFMAYFWSRVSETGGVGYILIQGLRFDLITLGMLLGLPAVLLTVLAPWRLFRPLINHVFTGNTRSDCYVGRHDGGIDPAVHHPVRCTAQYPVC